MKNSGSETEMPEAHIGLRAESRAESCFRLVYRSRNLLPDEPDGGGPALASILEVSRKNNRKQGVTGALVLYAHDRRFAQVLEGPEDDVLEVFERIRNDKRHDSLEIYESDPVPKRLFSRWAMALVVEHDEPDVPLVVTTGGLAEAAPWPVDDDQETILSRLRELTRGYGR